MKKAVLCIALLCLSLAGCAGMKEFSRKIAGTSTQELEKNRPFAVERTFKCPYDVCRDRAEQALLDLDTYMYANDEQKGLIAVYVSEEDTTPVGVFFESVSADETRLQVSSPSAYAKELIAEKLFVLLEERLE